MYSTSTTTHHQVYKLIRTLGEGAFGKVKLVKHLPSEKFVAMKEISKASLTTTSTN
jgi:serine/threonine protein kinase